MNRSKLDNCDAVELSGDLAHAHLDHDKARRGDELTAADKVYVKAQFIHRYTRDWEPDWVRASDERMPVHFDSDEEWLRHTYFAVNSFNRVERDHRMCYSVPVFPDGRRVKAKQLELGL